LVALTLSHQWGGNKLVALVSRIQDHTVALFRTGDRCAGENLTDLLSRRKTLLRVRASEFFSKGKVGSATPERRANQPFASRATCSARECRI
jgi:hypothetical protein